MEPHIAELLVRGGVVAREQLNQALDRQKKNASNLVQELVGLGSTSEDDVAASRSGRSLT